MKRFTRSEKNGVLRHREIDGYPMEGRSLNYFRGDSGSRPVADVSCPRNHIIYFFLAYALHTSKSVQALFLQKRFDDGFILAG